MTIKQFIEKAIDGGWNPPKRGREIENLMIDGNEYLLHSNLSNMFLDPLAWQAVGVTEGWYLNSDHHYQDPQERKCVHCAMHAMIDFLSHGKTIEQFLETL